MNISFNWLKEYVDLSMSAQECAKILTDIGLEVESFEKIETIKGGLEGVVVGEVLTCEAHPDSDHLHITTVDIGQAEPLNIVCGAANCRKGLKVMCATIGSVLYPIGSQEEFKIKRSKIRGVESLGMLCAEDELGIGSSHEGIIELPLNAKVGTAAKQYYNIQDDYLIGIGLTPNRVDAASHIGVARDLVAYLRAKGENVTLKLPDVSSFKVDNHDLEISVKVENTTACPRYTGVSITGCKLAPSPEWMQNYLRAAGINPKNNLVDITNFVLFELGQPLHAFDARKIDGNGVVVKTVENGTKFTTLDGEERTLTDRDLMICSIEKPMCIAGVFGGKQSGVSDETVDIFLESAYFNPVWVRKSAKRFGLNTDASFRFERGIDPNIQLYALKRAAILFRDLAGGKISSEITDSRPQEAEPFRFEFSLKRAKSLIGKNIPDETILSIIDALEVKVEKREEDLLQVAVPPYRVDVQREADLVEDILRIYGYNNIELPEHLFSTLAYIQKPDKTHLVNMVSDALTARGFTEIMSNSLTKASYYEQCKAYPIENAVKILNPLSQDLSVMRQTLLFNAMEAVELNVNHKNASLKLYEFGNCYFYDASKKDEQACSLAPYSEKYMLSLLITGQSRNTSWNEKATVSDFFCLRATVEMLLKRFGLSIYDMPTEEVSDDLYACALEFKLQNKALLRIGQLSQSLCKKFDTKQDVFYAEINFDLLLKATRKHHITVEELSKYPEVKRDLALLVDSSVKFAELRSAAFQAEKKLLKKVSLFDVYQGDKLPNGKKSYALSFILEDKNQTLNDKTIERVMDNLQKTFESKFQAQIR
ncbi:MAG: phenylalanine--tRNA ligase subunit beta [Alistipes sp.]|nr:phenylalanine--tRNA ligase subunit beta [Candidatus Alistipes equi]